MVLLIGIVLLNSVFLYRQESSIMVAQQESQIQIGCVEANACIRSVDSVAAELLSAIRNQYEGLRTGSGQQKTEDKLKLSRTLTDLKQAMPEFEYVFVIRPGDFTIFQGTDDIFLRLDLKDYIESNITSLASSSRQWRILQLGERVYFLHCYYYRDANIYVGVAAQPTTLFPELLALSRKEEMGLTLRDDFGNTVVFGQREYEKKSETYEGEKEIEGSLTLQYSFNIYFLTLMKKDIAVVLGIILLVSLLIYGISNRLVRKQIIQPVEKISHAVLGLGDISQETRIPEEAPVQELRQLETTINTLLQDAVVSRMELYTTELQKKSQELQMLRAQLRPHFFLNAITTVSTMTYRDQGEEIRNYLVRLSAFLRYIMARTEALAPLEDELECLENYLRLQEIRYPGRILWFREDGEGVKGCRIPRCLLLTIGENAVKYGMQSDDILQVFVQSTREENCIRIAIEDNGPGFSAEQLSGFWQGKAEEQAHVGLTNVRNTLEIQYGRGDLLQLTNAVPHGARVVIRIPVE